MQNTEDIEKKQVQPDFSATTKSLLVTPDDENLINVLNEEPKKPQKLSPKRSSPQRIQNNSDQLERDSHVVRKLMAGGKGKTNPKIKKHNPIE